MEIVIISIIGLLISVYAYYVERKIKKSVNYKAVCDISDTISCSKTVSSKYGKIFGVSNALVGFIFYILMIVLFFVNANLIFYFALLGVLGSVYFGYLQYFKLKSFCLVCTSIYVVNILLLLFSFI